MSKPERVFFALWPLGSAGHGIAESAARLSLDGRRVAAERLHLTLAFIGVCGPDQLKTLEARACSIEQPAFDLTLDRIGHVRRVGTTFIAPSASPAALFELAAALSPPAADASRFWPHITIARRARPPNFEAWPATTLRATEFALVASGRGGQPGAYRALGRWSLGSACRPRADVE